jgi:hypothetical protein
MINISKTDLAYSVPNRYRLLIKKDHVCMEIEKRNIFVRAIYLLRGQYNKCTIATKAVEIFAQADRVQNLSDRERNQYLNNLDAIVDRIPQTKFEELRNELHGKINDVREQCLATCQTQRENAPPVQRSRRQKSNPETAKTIPTKQRSRPTTQKSVPVSYAAPTYSIPQAQPTTRTSTQRTPQLSLIPPGVPMGTFFLIARK